MSQVHAQRQGATLNLSLAGALTIAEAAQTRCDLLTPLDAQEQGLQAVRLDLGAIPEIDSAGVQLLLSTARMVRARGLQAELARGSAAVQSVARLLGAADEAQCCGFSLLADPQATAS